MYSKPIRNLKTLYFCSIRLKHQDLLDNKERSLSLELGEILGINRDGGSWFWSYKDLFICGAGNSKETNLSGYTDDQGTWQDFLILQNRPERAALIQMRQCLSCLQNVIELCEDIWY